MEKKVRYYNPRTGETGELILIGLPEGVTAEELAAAIGAVEGEIPTAVSELINDAGYVDSPGAAAAAPVQSVDGGTGAVKMTSTFSSVAEIVTKANALGTGVAFWGNIPNTLANTMCGVNANANLWALKPNANRVDIMLWQGASNATYKVYWGNIDTSTLAVTLKTLANEADIPTAVSELTNDSGFITKPAVAHVNGNAVSVASGVATTVQTITLSAGVWAVEFDAQFASNATGYREIHLATTSGGGAMDRHSVVQVQAANGVTTRLTFTTFFSLSASTTYYLVATQNSGSALSVTPGYRYMKFS